MKNKLLIALIVLILPISGLTVAEVDLPLTGQIPGVVLNVHESIDVTCSQGDPLTYNDGAKVTIYCHEVAQPTPLPDPTPKPSADCTIEVGPSGDYATLQGAADNAQPGDIVCVTGTHTDDRVVLSRSGTADDPIIFRADPGTVLIGSFRLSGINYNTISGFEITGSTGSWCGVYIRSGSSYNTIEGNHIHNLEGAAHGVCIIGSSSNTIRENDIHNMFRNGVEIGGGVPQYNIIERNRLHDNSGDPGNADGLHLYADARYNILRNNVLYNNSDDGLDTWGSNYNLIYGNISYSNGYMPDGSVGRNGNGFKLGGLGGGEILS